MMPSIGCSTIWAPIATSCVKRTRLPQPPKYPTFNITPSWLGMRKDCGRNPLSSAAEGTDPRDIATHDQCVNVVCAFVRGDTLKVHEMPDNGVSISDACGAEDVTRLARASQRHPHI